MWNDQELSKVIGKDIPYPMVADQGGKMGRDYGVYDEDDCISTRGRFIIDPDGIVQSIEIIVPPVGRNIDEILRQLKALQLVRKTNGAEVTPTGWEPGKTTLNPGEDLVGKVWEKWSIEEAFGDKNDAIKNS